MFSSHHRHSRRLYVRHCYLRHNEHICRCRQPKCLPAFLYLHRPIVFQGQPKLKGRDNKILCREKTSIPVISPIEQLLYRKGKIVSHFLTLYHAHPLVSPESTANVRVIGVSDSVPLSWLISRRGPPWLAWQGNIPVFSAYLSCWSWSVHHMVLLSSPKRATICTTRRWKTWVLQKPSLSLPRIIPPSSRCRKNKNWNWRTIGKNSTFGRNTLFVFYCSRDGLWLELLIGVDQRLSAQTNEDWEPKRIQRPKGVPEWGLPPSPSKWYLPASTL